MRLKLLSSIISLLCISLFLYLGFWQLDRANEKEKIVNLYEERQLADTVELNSIGENIIQDKYYRNYKIKGRYINKTFLIDNKIKDKQPGFNVISLFQISSSKEIILVDRGWIKMKGQRQEIDKNFKFLKNQGIEKSVQEINGYIYPREKSYTIGRISTNKSWPRLLQAINFEEIKGTIEKDKLFVEGVVFRLNSDNKFGFKRDWKIVFMDSTKHLGYAFQWFSMALAFLILIIIFFVRMKNE
jgi:cytochrome oxidase assembly protein ShyY1